MYIDVGDFITLELLFVRLNDLGLDMRGVVDAVILIRCQAQV